MRGERCSDEEMDEDEDKDMPKSLYNVMRTGGGEGHGRTRAVGGVLELILIVLVVGECSIGQKECRQRDMVVRRAPPCSPQLGIQFTVVESTMIHDDNGLVVVVVFVMWRRALQKNDNVEAIKSAGWAHGQAGYYRL
jgi:hypothetical protein